MSYFKHFELIFWISAIVALTLADIQAPHFIICPLAKLGFTHCPGCGVGRAIASVLQGDFQASLNYHWFGIPALVILLHRIFVLSKKYFLSF